MNPSIIITPQLAWESCNNRQQFHVEFIQIIQASHLHRRDYSKCSLLPSTSSWITENLLSTQGDCLFLRLPPTWAFWLELFSRLWPAPGADFSSICLADILWGLEPRVCWANSFLKSFSDVFLWTIETGPENGALWDWRWFCRFAKYCASSWRIMMGYKNTSTLESSSNIYLSCPRPSCVSWSRLSRDPELELVLMVSCDLHCCCCSLWPEMRVESLWDDHHNWHY